MKPRDLACFNRAADKIGEEKTETELQKVIDCGGGKFWYNMTVNTNIKWDFNALERDTKVVFLGLSFLTRMREKFLIRYYKFINRFM